MGISGVADAVLVRDVLSGRRDCFDTLIERYYQAAYAVAYSRTGNAADAQDVTQEAFLRAFSTLNTLRDLDRFGAWLTGIARNVARNITRSAARELPRESASGEAAVEPNVESKDLHEFLRRQLATLDDDDREVLLMHYFTGLTTREIGDALGINRETAKKRLQRAREALSERVLAELGDAMNTERPTDRAKKQVMAIVAAAPLSWTPATSAGPAATAPAGALAAWKLAALSMAAVLAIALAVVLKTADGRSPAIALDNGNTPPVNALAAVESSGPNPGSGTVALAANANSNTNANARSKTDPPSTGNGMAVCEILDETAQPVVGAQVAIFSSQSGSVGPLPRKPLHEGHSDARGFVLFDNVPDGWYSVVARSEGLIGFGMNRVAQYGIGRIFLRPIATIEGVITDTDGAPVTGADVFVYRVRDTSEEYRHVGRNYAVKSDAKGHFALDLVGEGNWSLVIDADGYATQITQPSVAPGVLNAKLERGNEAMVKAYHADTGAPVPGVELVLRRERIYSDTKRAITGDDGVAHFTSLAAAIYSVSVIHDDLITADEYPNVTIESGSKNESGVAVMSGYKIAGRVIDGESKAGIPGCVVNFVQSNSGDPLRRSSTTDAEGRFRFVGVPKGRFDLRIPDPPKGFSLEEKLDQRRDEITGENTPEVIVALNNEKTYGGVVEGKVVDRDGAAVPRAFVRAEISFNNTRIVRADADGAFRIGGVKIIGDLRLFAHYPGLASGGGPTHTVTAEGLRDVVLTVQPTGSINGFVKSKSGNPINLEHPAVKQTNPFETGTVFNHFSRLYFDGAFRLSDLPPGDYPIYFDPETNMMMSGIVVPEATVSLKAGEHVENIILTYKERPLLSQSMTIAPQAAEPPKWTLNGRTTYADTGEPVTEYRMEVHQGGHTSLPKVNDPEGKFSTECDGESVLVEIYAKGAKKFSKGITKLEAAHDELSFALQRGCVVGGVVVNDSGTPLSGARIVVNKLPAQHDIDRSDAPTTLSDGTFRVDTLEEQETRLFAVHPAYAVSSVLVIPKATTPLSTSITLLTGARLEGTITVGGKPARNARVNARPQQYNAHQRLVSCDDAGRFVVEHLMPITTDLSAMLSGVGKPFPSRSEMRPVELAEGETTTVNIDFPEASSRIEGTISILNATMMGATVNVNVERDGVKENVDSPESGSAERSGAFRTADLPAGTATLRVRAILDNVTTVSKSIRVEVLEGSTITQDVVFAGNCSVSGTIGGPLAAKKPIVVAIPRDAAVPEGELNSGTLLENAIAQQVGVEENFRLSCLDPGSYTIRAVIFEPGGGEPKYAQAEVTLSGGAEETINLEVLNN